MPAPLSFKNDEQADERLNPANDLHAREQAGYDREFDDIAKNYDKTADPTQENQNIAAAREQENSPSSGGWAQKFTGKATGKGSKFDIKGVLRKKGATGAIITLMLGGGIFGLSSMASIPALLLVQVKNTLMNDLSDSTPAVSQRSMLMMQNKIKGLSVHAGVCSNAVTIRCKFSTMSNRQVKRFEKAGFKVNPDEESLKNKIPGRNAISSLEFTKSDGTKVTISTPQEMKAFARDPEGAAALFKAFNPKTAYFLNGDFTKMLATKFHLSKESKVEPGDEKKVDESFDKSTGADSIPPEDEGGRMQPVEEDAGKLSSAANVANIALAGFGVGCTTYITSSKIIYTVKTIKIAAFAMFAMTFLTETDKMIAGNGDPSVLSALGNQMTTTDNRKTIVNPDGKTVKNPDYGKSPTDSQGYQLSAFGKAAPEQSAEKFSLGPTGVLLALSGILALPNKIPFGKSILKHVCKIISSMAFGGVAATLGCDVSGILDAFTSTAACVAAQAAIGVAIGYAVSKGIGKLVEYIIHEYGPMALGSKTFGPDVGNAMFAGTAAITSGQSASLGMTPGNKSTMQQYFADTDQIRKQNTAAQVYLAQAQPFDIYNHYSFLGSIMQPLSATLYSQTTFASKVASFMNLIPMTLGLAGQVGASYNEAAQPFNPARYDQCNDPQLKAIGVDGDEFCNVRYQMDANELNMDPDQNAQYMVNGGYVDATTGAPTNTPQGDLYQNYLTNCANRVDPLGSAENMLDANDWQTGKNCMPGNALSQTQLDNFGVFKMDMDSEDAMDQDPSAGTGDTTTPTPTAPTTASAQDLAKEMLQNSNISYVFDAKQDVVLASEGKPGTCNAPIDPRLLAVALDIAKKHTLVISAIESHCTGHMAGSDHYKGKAIDFADIDGEVAYLKIASVWPDIKQDASGAYFLQRQCTGGATPNGMSWISGDTCSHIHMSVGSPGG